MSLATGLVDVRTDDVEVHTKARRSEGMTLALQTATRVDDIFATVLKKK